MLFQAGSLCFQEAYKLHSLLNRTGPQGVEASGSPSGGCPREDATQKEARGKREKERQGTKNDSPDEELLQA